MESKILKIVIILILCVGAVFLGVWGYSKYFGEKKVTDSETYICPMHPQIVQDRFGTCPICGMDLVKKSELDDEDISGHDVDDGLVQTVKLSPSQQVLANVQTEKAKLKEFSGEKTFNGYVKINEKKFAHISTAVSGKIVQMFVNFEGQYVKYGQQVLEIYSPELVATKKEYLLALDNLNQVMKSGNTIAIEQAQSLVNASRQRLSLWEMTHQQIDELERTRNVEKNTTLYSRYSGVITKKYVHVGHWAMAGEDIYDVADMSTVWVIANIYESDMQYIRNGQMVEITSSAYPDETIRAQINFVNPVFNAESRTLEVRIDVSNKESKLKPDMFVKVKVNTYKDQLVAVSKNAVIRKGDEDIVYVETQKGVYVPRQVKVKFEQDGYYAISDGLKAGEVVVSSGGFLIDSESQIQKGINFGHEQHTDSKKTKDDDIKINPGQDIIKDMEKKKETNHKH